MIFTRTAHASASLVLAAALVSGGAISASAAPEPAITPAATPVTDVTSLVDPFVSTEDDYGQDLPGAQAPNSLVKINPMTTPDRSHTGYDYAEDQIAGFTHTNLDGVGGSGAGGDLLVVPTYVDYTQRPDRASYAKTYSHDAEEASPGYYRVDLTTTEGTDSDVSDAPGADPIVAEATTDTRAGWDRFTFPEAGTASLVLDLANNFTDRRDATLAVTELPDGRAALSGEVVGYFNGYEYRLFYYAESTAPTAAVRTWGGNRMLSTTSKNRAGTDIGAILDFDVEAGEQVGLQVAISTISAEQAAVDFGVEIADRTFGQIRTDTRAAWEDLLGRVAISTSATSDPDGTLARLFYTHLYRMLATPVNATSTSGTYRSLDGTIRQAEGYTHYDGWGFWDDFRKYGALAIAYPDLYADMAQSIVDLFAGLGDSGASRLGSLTHAVPTVRFERAAVVLADAIAKGAQPTGLAQAWPGLVTESQGRYADESNVELGYIANEMDETLGTAYDDWAMSTIATALGYTDEARAYRDRATNWVNIFSENAVELPGGTTVGLNLPRRADGTFADIDPERFQAGNLYQGTAWQYHWYMAPDMGGLIDLMGGRENTLAALSYMFGEQAPDDGSRMLHSNANEIDLQAPYLFNYVGAPSKTQHWVRSIYTEKTWNRYIATGSTSYAPSSGGEFTPPVKTRVYSLDPQGFLPTMDNDTGTMSSMFVAAGLGLFPVNLGSDQYQIGSPFFERTTITYPSGSSFTISADGVSADSYYIQSARLNGAAFDRTWVTYDQLMAGGELAFTMGSEPSDWAADGIAPPSLSDVVDSSIYEPDSPVSLDSREFHEAPAGDGSIGNSLTLSLADGAFAGADGDDLAAGGAIEASGVPAGLTLSAIRVDDRTVQLSLTGRAAASTPLDSTDDLRLSVTDAAFAQRLDDAPPALDLRVTFAGVTVSADRLTMRAGADGALEESVVLTMHGARFAGAEGRDLVADGDLTLPGLPEGLEAAAEKTGPSTLDLRVHGTIERGASFVLRFADGAFEATPAPSISGDGLGLRAFTVALDRQWHAQLADLYERVRLIEKGNYASSTFAGFEAARTAARDLLAAEDASEQDLRSAFYDLQGAVGSLSIAQSPHRRLQAESSDDWSGGDLKAESSTDSSGVPLGNLGGVRDGSWIAYGDLDFAGAPPETFTIRYVNNSGRGPADSRVALRLDAPDGPLLDEVALPSSGSSWSDYTTVEHTLTDPSLLEGSHTLYLVFEGSTTEARPWIGNIDWAQFSSPGDGSEAQTARVEAEAFTDSNGNGLKTETSTDDAGNTIGNVGGTWDGGVLTYDDVDLSAREFSTLSVRYANNSGRTGPGALIEVRLDDAANDPIATIPLPTTGTSWSAYRTVTAALPAEVTGVHTLVITMRARTDSGHPYVANFDWFEFGGADLTELRQAVEAARDLLPQRDRYIAVDFGVFERALQDAQVTLEDPTSLQPEVDDALWVLNAAQEQLEWVVVRELAEVVDAAESLDTTAYTRESVEAFEDALAQARGLAAGASHADYTAALDGLVAAIDGLVEMTVPARPAAPAAELTAPTTITVRWSGVSDDGGSAVTGYRVSLSGDADAATVTVDAGTTSADFTDLVPGATYTATVTALNALGAGAESPASAAVTTEAAPTDPTDPTDPDPTDPTDPDPTDPTDPDPTDPTDPGTTDPTDPTPGGPGGDADPSDSSDPSVQPSGDAGDGDAMPDTGLPAGPLGIATAALVLAGAVLLTMRRRSHPRGR
ncbi:carbohydrate-binding protein [Pseudactinotalea sp. HY160]|uniref:glycoside hydrolase domain-containing protein n=1 Tax=Pseudactinotalea sp. HY160 TaxID=2654490 RepID=UPI00128D92AD|nr:carbohydrate-binding protein [Pseudactinotalea sp. HY160]